MAARKRSLCWPVRSCMQLMQILLTLQAASAQEATRPFQCTDADESDCVNELILCLS